MRVECVWVLKIQLLGGWVFVFIGDTVRVERAARNPKPHKSRRLCLTSCHTTLLLQDCNSCHPSTVVQTKTHSLTITVH